MHQAWDTLVSLLLGHNKFNGSIPDALYNIPLLTYLDINSNE